MQVGHIKSNSESQRGHDNFKPPKYSGDRPAVEITEYSLFTLAKHSTAWNLQQPHFLRRNGSFLFNKTDDLIAFFEHDKIVTVMCVSGSFK